MRNDHKSRTGNAVFDAKAAEHVPPSRTTSRELLGAARELIIEHQGREYRLRLTQQGKLILTA